MGRAATTHAYHLLPIMLPWGATVLRTLAFTRRRMERWCMRVLLQQCGKKSMPGRPSIHIKRNVLDRRNAR